MRNSKSTVTQLRNEISDHKFALRMAMLRHRDAMDDMRKAISLQNREHAAEMRELQTDLARAEKLIARSRKAKR